MPTPLCVYVKFNGVQCGSPALRGKVFCYHHARSRTARQSNIVIAPPDSPDAVMYTIHALTQLMLNAKITVQEYRAAVHGFRVTTTLLRMAAQNADQPRVTHVSRHISSDIAFAGPDADPEEPAVGARLASPANTANLVIPTEGVSPSGGTTPLGSQPAQQAALLDPPIELERNSKTAALGASVSHAALADHPNLDPALKENATIDPRPTLPKPEFKFKPRPLTQEERDNPYVRPSGDAVRDLLERERLRRELRWG